MAMAAAPPPRRPRRSAPPAAAATAPPLARPRGRPPMTLLVLALALALLLVRPAPAAAQRDDIFAAAPDGFDADCNAPLLDADRDGDGRVTRDEYVIFANGMSSDYFASACRPNRPDRCDFGQLPLPLQANFINLACICAPRGGSNECCTGDNAHISAAGVEATLNDAQLGYLFRVCRDTQDVIDRFVTARPTAVPTTLAPTRAPTPSPTEEPTLAPTPRPTRLPVADPSPAPTSRPTPEPTARPTRAPVTLAPVMVPTTSQPTAAPVSSTPTPVPTALPTRAPTNDITGEVTVEFQFAASNIGGYGANEILTAEGEGNTVRQDLEEALDQLLAEVVAETFGTAGRRTTTTIGHHVRARRRLAVEFVQGTTSVDAAEDVECPDAVESESETSTTRSCQIVTSSATVYVTDEDPEEITERLEAAIAAAIAEGRLDEKLARVNPSSPVDRVGPAPIEPKSGLGGGAIAGIVIGGLVLMALLAALLVSRMSRGDDERELANGDAVQGDLAAAGGRKGDDDSSAGSSGWSSGGASSSIDTREEHLPGSGGAVDAIPQDGKLSKGDLDAAIDAGDWAAVGATAALLASASDSASTHTGASSKRSSGSRASSVESLDAARAAELDQLVDAGDWEGVVLAAAKFEAETGTTSGQSGSASGSFTGSRSMGSKGSASGAAKKAEIRMEVEALVRRVVPDEIDNVDEMMEQFSGREEELLANLRNMQEKSIAQRARAAVHKSAKQEAKRSVQEKRAAEAAALYPQGVPPSKKSDAEEQEALAQAKIWEEVAAQSKSDSGAEAQGASEAADWAISRSLASMKKADESSGDAGSSREV